MLPVIPVTGPSKGGRPVDGYHYHTTGDATMTLNEAQKAYEQAILKVETAQANLHSARADLLAIEKADYDATKAECTRRKVTK